MNPDAKQKWVAALRSGEFEQCTGALEAPGRRLCCLGVACVVAEREGVEVARHTDDTLLGATLQGSQAAVNGWLDLTRIQETKLMECNDSGRWPFERIADYIEKGIK